MVVTLMVCVSLNPAGVPLSERDPGAVSELLLPDQPERGPPGREGHGPAGHPGQGGGLG